MKSLLKRFAKDENGFIISTELVLIGTIAVLGLIAGLVEVRDQVVQELGDFSQAVAQLDQSYRYNAVTTEASGDAQADTTGGGIFTDSVDAQATTNADAGGISVNGSAVSEASS
ncbi:MAG: hypothetical protein KDA90_13835 [Planctomycetaceae bacterium]|nr:hypothetical protein [Planctomycetaceae bacterium]